MIFAAFIRIRLKRNNGSKALLYLVTADFIVSTAFLALDVTASQVSATLLVITASNALYTCTDLISQIILVNFFTYIVSTTDASGFSFLNIDIPMLDRLAPTMDYGCPDPVITCIFRYTNLHNLN